MSKIYVFVYGTLMKNQRNHGYLEDAIYIGDGVLNGYQMYDLGRYPGIVVGDGTVLGEVYQVNEEIEKQLDVMWQLENVLAVCNHGEALYDKQRKK